MPRHTIVILTLITALSLTAALSFFAVSNYQSARPIADDNLRGLALTIASAMEGIAGRDSSLKLLDSFQANEIAYAMLITESGKILFHSNSDLTGNELGDDRFRSVLRSGTFTEGRIILGTGEEVYEFQAPFHLSGKTCVLRLALHTWRSEAVMRRAVFGIALIFSLLALGWVLGGSVYWLLHRQQVKEKLFARQHELARLGEVGAVLAHEVRNPLAGIKGYAQLLEERLPEGRERGYAELIVRESLRLEHLANDILLFTRADSVHSGFCNVFSVVAAISELLAPQLESSRITLNVNVADNLTVRCSEDGLHRIIINILTNAIQSMPDGGNINLTARNNFDMVELSIADNGTGIDQKIRAVLFEPFCTTKAKGAGLGLAVCKKIVDGCAGTISVEDATGGGTIFLLKLPAALQKDCE